MAMVQIAVFLLRRSGSGASVVGAAWKMALCSHLGVPLSVVGVVGVSSPTRSAAPSRLIERGYLAWCPTIVAAAQIFSFD
jgi:hypothetical protein